MALMEIAVGSADGFHCKLLPASFHSADILETRQGDVMVFCHINAVLTPP